MEIRIKQKIDKYIGYLLIAILLPFTRLLGITMSRDHSAEEAPRRILFIKLMGIGSLIVASDAIGAIRRKFPQTRLVLLTDDNIAAAILPFGVFDEIHAVDTNNLWSTAVTMIRFFFRSWSWRGLWVCDLEVYSKLTTVLALLTLARNRFGFFLPPVPFRKYLNTHKVPFDQRGFLGCNYRTMAEAITDGRGPSAEGIVDGRGSMAGVMDGPGPLPAATAAHGMTVPGAVRRSGENARPYIVVNNTCSGLAAVRRLPEPVLTEVCQWILEHTSYSVALVGGPGDRAAIERFVAGASMLAAQKERILNVAGMTASFEAYYAFLRNLGVMLVTIDSGPLHMARKLGLPTVSVWGPTDPANYLEIREEERARHLYFYSKAPCSPCVHRFERPPCGGNNTCMQDIPAAVITGMIGQLLELLRRNELSQRIETGTAVLV